jgi:peptidoglycan/xylan/chitin deacetylase (PgdA/CDA1 family)
MQRVIWRGCSLLSRTRSRDGHPEITKQVIAAGMTIGTHTWSHKDLARNPYAKDIEQAKAEIEMGISAVHMAAGGGNRYDFERLVGQNDQRVVQTRRIHPDLIVADPFEGECDLLRGRKHEVY